MRCNAAAYEGLKPYIFISYSHDDEMRVYPYIEMLARAGCRVWYDEGIAPGDEWPEVIARHLEGCEVFVALITDASMNSHNCRREINYAISLNKEILCLYIDDARLSSAMSMLLSSVQAIYRSKYTIAEDFITRILQNAAIERCRGAERNDIEVFSRIDDGDMTVTMTQADYMPRAASSGSVLIRVNTQEEIRISKSLFTVGRSEEHSDYAFKGEPSISRRHMTIKRVGNSCFVIDNESLNHVLLNGRLIAPDVEYELASFDVLLLAREPMVFIRDHNPDYIHAQQYTVKTEEESFDLGSRTIVRIGSRKTDETGRGCDIRLPAEDAEPEHGFIINAPEGVYLVSTSIMSATLINGRDLPFGQKRRMLQGDVITIGRKQLELLQSV